MSTSCFGWIFLLLACLCEGVAQLAFKRATDRVRESDRLLKTIRRVLKHWPRLAIGIACFLTEAALWTLALHRLKLSVAFPAASLSLIAVALLAWLGAGEKLDSRRWIGVLLILAGTAMVSVT